MSSVPNSADGKVKLAVRRRASPSLCVPTLTLNGFSATIAPDTDGGIPGALGAPVNGMTSCSGSAAGRPARPAPKKLNPMLGSGRCDSSVSAP